MELSLELTENSSGWEQFLLANSPNALFQSWEWGEVEKKRGAKVWRLGWFEGNKLVGIAQIIKISAKRGTFLHIRHGPIGKINFKDVRELAKKEGAWFIRVSPQIHDDAPYKKLGFVSASVHEVDGERCWVLELTKSEEELLMGMRKTTRYEIKHAHGVVVEKTNDISRFITLYDATSKRHNFVQHKGIREEFETLDTDLFIASYEGCDLAAAIIVYFGDEAIYHHGASVPSKVPASYLLQWEAIRQAKKRGKKVYNFWGVAPENKKNHPWRGITLFKKGFGGREINYIHAQDFAISPFYVIPKTVEMIRTKFRGY